MVTAAACDDVVLVRSASGVVGKAEQFDGARLPVVVVLALLVVAGVGQQRPLGVPGDGEGRRVALHLPQLLSWETDESHYFISVNRKQEVK